MKDIERDVIQLGKVTLYVTKTTIEIHIDGIEKPAFVDYSDEFLELLKEARLRVPKTDSGRAKYKFPYSNAYKKTLHQMVFDFYFGEAKRKNLYGNGYTIKHTDKDGFNCRLLNLYFSKGTRSGA